MSGKDPKEIIRSWEIDQKALNEFKMDLSHIDEPYAEVYKVEGVELEEYYAASTVLAFLKYLNEYSEDSDEGREFIEEAIKGIERFRQRDLIEPSSLGEQEYGELLERSLEERNLNERVVKSEFGEDEELTDYEDFISFERDLIYTLLGKKV